MPNTTFAQRFTQACDDSPIIPEYGKGRQVAIAKRLHVTQEAVRKWFTGDAVPKAEKMKTLSDYLDVDEAWLALGIRPEMDKATRRKAGRVASGSVYITAGLVMLEGGNVAWPGDKDPRNGYVDIYAIMRGTQVSLHVSTGREVSSRKYEVIVPHEYEDVQCIGFIHDGPGRFHLLDLQTSLIRAHKQRRAGDYSMSIVKDGAEYYCGSDKVSRFKTLGEIL